MNRIEAVLKPYYTLDEERHIWKKLHETSVGYFDSRDTEKDLFNAIKGCTDRSTYSDELPARQKWFFTYHLSAMRSNLLRPLESRLKKSRILEIGCECGALTRYLGEVAPEVVAIENNVQRASIAALRCEGLDNVTIIADTVENLPENIGKFDVVTLVKALEAHPSPDFLQALEKARYFLKPGGILFLAQANKFGLKYFAGIPEEHSGVAWAGIMGVAPATYSRKEIDTLLMQAGFGSRQQSVAFPDYKLPITIISPQGLACEPEEFRQSALLTLRAHPYENKPLFNTKQTWEGICKAGLLPDMADSLCFTATNDEPETRQGETLWEKDVLASHYSYSRNKLHAKETKIKRLDKGIYVTRHALFPELHDTQGPLQIQLEDESYIQGPLLIEHMRHVMLQPGWTLDNLARVLQPWADWLASYRDSETETVPFEFFEAGPFNIIVREDNTLAFFDREWNSEQSIPIQSILFQTLMLSLNMIGPMVAKPGRKTSLNYFHIVSGLINKLGFAFSKHDTDIIKKSFTLMKMQGQRVNLGRLKRKRLKEIKQSPSFLFRVNTAYHNSAARQSFKKLAGHLQNLLKK